MLAWSDPHRLPSARHRLAKLTYLLTSPVLPLWQKYMFACLTSFSLSQVPALTAVCISCSEGCVTKRDMKGSGLNRLQALTSLPLIQYFSQINVIFGGNPKSSACLRHRRATQPETFPNFLEHYSVATIARVLYIPQTMPFIKTFAFQHVK